MSCSAPFVDKLLHKLGYESACIVHDLDYEKAISYRHKLRSDQILMKNMISFVPKWYSYPIGALAVFILTTNPFSYYLYFKNKHNRVGHAMAALWLGLSVYSLFKGFT